MCSNFVIKYIKLLYRFKHENSFLPNSKFCHEKCHHLHSWVHKYKKKGYSLVVYLMEMTKG